MFAGGYTGSAYANTIDYVAVAVTGNATDFGDLTVANMHDASGCSNGVRAVFAGGSSQTPHTNQMQYVTIATTGNATDFGDLLSTLDAAGACSDGTRGVFGGGNHSGAGNTGSNIIQYITISTTGNATDFGDLTVARRYLAGLSGT